LNVNIHQGYLPGVIGRVAELHASYYSQSAGFGVYFECKVARELAAFFESYDEGRDAMWFALVDGNVEGSIAVDGTHAVQGGAHLRWFITSDKLRGRGTGNALLAAALDLCRAQKYERVFLWTFSGLSAARHLYEKVGFRLIHEQAGSRWGPQVSEQRFELSTMNATSGSP
jgi:GNAT superfamily N-acetyltransferase